MKLKIEVIDLHIIYIFQNTNKSLTKSCQESFHSFNGTLYRIQFVLYSCNVQLMIHKIFTVNLSTIN